MDKTKRPGQKSKEKKRTKICSVIGCKKILGSHNKSGLCYHHLNEEYNFRTREKLRREGRCLSCGKSIYTLKCPKCGEIIKSYSKCKKCLDKNRINSKKRYNKNKKEIENKKDEKTNE